MNTKNEKPAAEKISAYIDDALSLDEIESLFGVNENNDKPFSVATRYHMVGEAIRGELSDASMVDVSRQIHQALSDETFDTAEPARTVKPAQQTGSRFDFSAWLESFTMPLAGMAVAASVAVLTVVAVVQMESPEGGQQLVTLPATTQDALLANQSSDNSLSNEQKMAEFDAYLTEHAEFAAQDTLQGRIPYVRAVSYQAE